MKDKNARIWVGVLLAGYLLPSLALTCFFLSRSAGSPSGWVDFIHMFPLASYAFLRVFLFVPIPIWLPAVAVGVPFLTGLFAVKKAWGRIVACCALAVHLLCSATAPIAYFLLSGVRGGM